MCRTKNSCTELDIDPSKWNKECLLPIPTFITSEIEVFIKATDLFFDGKKDECLMLIESIKSKEMTDWYVEHGQMSGRQRRIGLNKKVPEKLAEELRDPVRSPARIQEAVFTRDGYRCRYCGAKLISQKFIKLFIEKLNSPFFRKGKDSKSIHGIIHLTWPVADHVVPWNLGGRTNLENLVSACAPCNYGKDGNTLEQLGLNNPFERAPLVDAWDGFVGRIEALKR
ncbi:MAG TPA: HNH endonuclease [Bacteroidia bacterium]|nr:HNH endonuclease [Bacteroidia bacterium]